MLDNLRFADGRSLKDCLAELKLKRRLEEAEKDVDQETTESDGADYDSEDEDSMQDEEIQGSDLQESYHSS